MKNPFKKRSTAADIETELAKLSGKKAELERQRSEKLQSLEEAKVARRDALAEDDATIAEASAKVRRLAVDVDDMAAMIDEYSAAIEAAQERFRTAQDAEVRQAAAARLESIAARVDPLAAELEKNVAALANTFCKMTAVIPAEIALLPGFHLGRMDDRNRDPAGRQEVVAAVVAESLLSACPELFQIFTKDGYRAGLMRIMTPNSPQPDFRARTAAIDALPAGEAVKALVTGRLRARAADILAGNQPPELNDIRPPVIVKEVESVPEVAIFSLRDFSYVSNWDGRLTLVGSRWHHWVPAPVAKAAIAREFALAIDSPTGAKAYADEKERREANFGKSWRQGALTADQCVALGDVMGLVARHKDEMNEFRQSQASAEDVNEAARATG